MQSGNLSIVLITWRKLTQTKGLTFNVLTEVSLSLCASIIAKTEVENTSMTGKVKHRKQQHFPLSS